MPRKIETGIKTCEICKKEYTRRGRQMVWWIKSRFCSYKCMGVSKVGKSPMQGRKHTKESKLKSSLTKKGKPNLKIRGEKHYMWKGGVTPINEKIRHSLEYKQWRTSVFERDNYTCQMCGIRNKSGLGQSVILQADHIKSFKYFPEFRFDINNGRTLCLNCHKLTDNFGYKSHKNEKEITGA